MKGPADLKLGWNIEINKKIRFKENKTRGVFRTQSNIYNGAFLRK